MTETVFFGRTYGEAMNLLIEARDYFADTDAHGRITLAPLGRLEMCLETLRLTARLTQVMAWLLAQRAVHAEEMELEEALAEPLAEIDICMEAAGHDNPDLPPRLSDLLGRSHLLYVRVARLDQLARRAL